MSWFEGVKTPKIKEKPSDKVVKVPEGFWVKCSSCGEILQSKVLKDNLQVCPECDFHFRVGAWERIAVLTQDHTFEEIDAGLRSNDPLKFNDTKPYVSRLERAAESTHQLDAIVTGRGTIAGTEAMLGSFEFRFMGGSMGAVVGEKIARLFEAAIENELPAVIVSSSGGARMQEGILSLMQMAKTSALVAEMKRKGLPYISVLADPTTGGVAASFAMLGDIIVAEPGALIGFAGPRVIEQTMRQGLPKGFQRSEFLLKHGFVDMIVHRKDLPQTLSKILNMLKQGSWPKTARKNHR
ncbi:MAG: acetyl-CoA carboxylase carboxyltransferase subunit beta [Deltaproteobacteria bacterium]|nr:acetyl-CoA carboxylase carboxyltransferase subunit beta [Deltaproteobacteria bacterium]